MNDAFQRIGERQLQALAHAAHEAGVGVAADGTIVEWNPAAERVFGWPRADALGRPFAALLLPARVRAEHEAGLARFFAAGAGVYEVARLSMHGRDGCEHEIDMALAALPPGAACTAFAFLQPVADEQTLYAQAMQDPLTGLANRRMFARHLIDAMNRTRRSGQPMALLYMDIDHFKSVNDKLGHATGDALICAFGERILQTVRETDLVARLGGDEFVVVLEILHDHGDAETVAAKLVAALAEGFDLPGQRVRVSTSLGVALFDGDDTHADTLVARADRALYAAKRAGRNGWRVAEARADPASPPPGPAGPLAEFVSHGHGMALRKHFLEDLLAAIRAHLGMEVAFIAEFVGDQRVFRHVDAGDAGAPIRPGDGGPLDESYCQRVVDGRLPEIIADALLLPEALTIAATRALPVRAHVSVPIRLSDGRLYGTLCCFSTGGADATLNARDAGVLHTFAALAARHIERLA